MCCLVISSCELLMMQFPLKCFNIELYLISHLISSFNSKLKVVTLTDRMGWNKYINEFNFSLFRRLLIPTLTSTAKDFAHYACWFSPILHAHTFTHVRSQMMQAISKWLICMQGRGQNRKCIGINTYVAFDINVIPLNSLYRWSLLSDCRYNDI